MMFKAESIFSYGGKKTQNICAIKAVFSEENYVPQPQIELASMFTALYCVTIIQAEIHQLFQEKACTNTIFGQTLNYKVLWLR